MKSYRNLFLAACVPAGAAALPLASQNISRPNVVLIITDQQQASKIGYLGDEGIHTPVMDRIAREGVVFQNARCTYPLSAPQRFAMFTGLYPSCVGFRFNTRTAEDRAKLDWETIDAAIPKSLANVFKAAGYRTYYGGKSDIPSRESNLAPEYYGFETVYSTDERDMLGTDFSRALMHIVEKDKPFLMVASFLNPHDICLYDTAYQESDKLSGEYRGNNWAFRSLERVCMARNTAAMYSDDVFYKSVAPPLPPNSESMAGVPEGIFSNPGCAFSSDGWRMYRYIYDRLVEEVDTEIAPVLYSLEKGGFLNNTIIVFMSDHGEMDGAHGLGWKGVPFEEAQRVPFIISGPGLRKGVIDETTRVNTGVDLIPTLCELAGIGIPEGLHGQSVAAACFQGGKVSERKYTFHEGDNWMQVIEEERYKYTVVNKPGTDPFGILVDLKKDPGELQNLAGNRKYGRILERLSEVLSDHEKAVAGHEQ
ncbi:MAG: sulfatase-like hydrolase/transferase [Bacteroidales bacterium]|nr:sulfatase-like hydrolase/transferase [Bacteroidales bacterium]